MLRIQDRGGGATIRATMARTTGSTIITAGKATLQDQAQLVIHFAKNISARPIERSVEMPETMQDMSPERRNAVTTGV